MQINKLKLPKNSVIITDQNVKKFYGKYFKKFPIIVIKPGEKNKKLQTIESLAEKLVDLGADRSTTLIALGGGVVGDITGFLASIYMRGVDFIQIPTTLLAMIDASIGGKTGVDLDKGKNLVGTFHQPKKIILDLNFLQTLPEKDWQNGMAEIIKHSIIDGKLFYWIDKNKDKIKKQDKNILKQLINKNIAIKKNIVNKDERERGVRAILNLGHTFGHAIETLSNYKIEHGKAVAIGLVYSAKIGNLKELDKLVELLKYFGLPTIIPSKYKPKDILKAMKADKKVKNKKIVLIIPEKLGQVKIVKNYLENKIIKCLN